MSSDSKWFKSVDETGWMQLQSLLIKGAIKVANLLETHGASVVTHCSDGWDRTSQIASLVELILDQHSRTLVGFLALINKEWCRFGHMFNKRSGHGCKSNKEMSPIFHQFVDAAWQLLNQLPTEFEFNEDLLLFLVESCYSCRFGNFLFNTEKEFMAQRSKVVCIWSYILHHSSAFTNPLYHPSNEPLFAASGRLRDLEMWRGCYARSRHSQRFQSKANDKIKSLKDQNVQFQHLLKSGPLKTTSTSLSSTPSLPLSSSSSSSSSSLMSPSPFSPSSYSSSSLISSSSSSSKRISGSSGPSFSTPSASVASSLPTSLSISAYHSSPASVALSSSIAISSVSHSSASSSPASSSSSSPNLSPSSTCPTTPSTSPRKTRAPLFL